jgi:alpha-L-fucosidase
MQKKINFLFLITVVAAVILVSQCRLASSDKKTNSGKPHIQKLGTVDCDMVETTPIVFNDRLYRFESVRNNYKPNKTGDSYFRFIDVESGKSTPAFATGYHLGSAFVQNDTVFVYGVNSWGASNIQVFWSTDMKTWFSQSVLRLEGWEIFNNSVCKGSDRYIMAFEVGAPPEIVGTRFTSRFAESHDLLNWKLLPDDYVYSKGRYTACPTMKFLKGYFYMTYLELRPGRTFDSYIIRSEDLIHWKSSPVNPVLQSSPEDKVIYNPDLTNEQREIIANADIINNSDVDLCEFKGKVHIYYSCGNQLGIEFLAYAVYDGSLEDLLIGFFPE